MAKANNTKKAVFKPRRFGQLSRQDIYLVAGMALNGAVHAVRKVCHLK
jgi:hypothetical protein